MLSHDISPIIFRLGHFQVTYYALVYLLGFLTVLFIFLRASKKKEINLSEGQIYNLIILTIVGVIIGARTFHVLFWDFEYFSSHLIDILMIWKGGLSFHGGLFGAIVAIAFYSKKVKVNFWKISDIIVLPAILFLALGRIVCFINQAIVGTITNVPWCFKFEYSEGCRHPVQLYASAGRFALFGFLLYIKNKLKNFKPGFLSWIFITLMGSGRFFSDFLREGTKYSGLLAGQWFAVIMFLTGTIVLFKNYKKDIRKLLTE